jgi:hypothetical protein
MLVREIIAVYSEIIRNTNTLFDRNEKFLMLQKVVHVITILSVKGLMKLVQ